MVLGNETKVNDMTTLAPQLEESERVLLIDADTIAYAVCCSVEEGDDDAGYTIDLDVALKEGIFRVEELINITGCKSAELHFSSGKNFRHFVTDTYKSNRKSQRYPEGLAEVKQLLSDEYEGKVHTEIEADDYVVWAKKMKPDHYLLCAVDKDVLNAVAGTHFNYYQSQKYNIPMKEHETTKEYAVKFPFIQCLMGDSTDGITGVPRVGPKKAEKILEGITSEKDMWEAVVIAYQNAGLSSKEAIMTMRLVNMNQLNEEGELELWTEMNLK